MKKLVFAALLCGGIAQLGTGCIITSSDDDPNVIYDGTISASWVLVSGDGNTPVGCPDGATTMEVITEDLTGYQIVDKFDCALGGGLIDREPGTYDIWTRLADDTSVFTYAQSLTDVVDFLGLDVTVGPQLTMPELVDKLEIVMAAAERLWLQFPNDRLDESLPSRNRPFRVLGHHIFRVPEAFVELTEGDPLTYEKYADKPPADMKTVEQIAAKLSDKVDLSDAAEIEWELRKKNAVPEALRSVVRNSKTQQR